MNVTNGSLLKHYTVFCYLQTIKILQNYNQLRVFNNPNRKYIVFLLVCPL